MCAHCFPCAAVPSPPLNFSAQATGPYTVLFSWAPPPAEDGSGIITQYVITCTPPQANLPKTFTAAGSYTVDGFIPATEYNCSITATNSAGNSIPAMAVHPVTLHEDGMYMYRRVAYSQVMEICTFPYSSWAG